MRRLLMGRPGSCAPRWATWLVVVLAGSVLLYAIDIVFHPLSPDSSDLVQKYASTVAFFGAAALCALRARTSHSGRSIWVLFALALVLWGAGSTYYSVFLWDLSAVPVPSGADVFWLVFYVPAYAALYRLLRQGAGSFARGVWLDALVGGLGVGGAAATLAFQNVVESTHGSLAEVAINLAYPIADLGLLALVVGAITVTGWQSAGSWRWIAPAFALFAVTDSIFLFTSADGTYTVGGVLDLGWPLAALLVGIAAWRGDGRAEPLSRPTSKPRMVIPAVSSLAALVLLAADHFHRTNVVAIGLATISIFFIFVRLYLTAIDNRRLLAISRREATTDSLTGLSNRRQMTTDLAAHVAHLDPDHPLMLTLFDLDGFKQYNDTFGHVAGDRVLERLAARLDGAGPGAAYRVGGDEFCTLERLSDGDEAGSWTAEAAAALSERGDGFSISCSHGSVMLPGETADATDAMRMADRRMYTRKGAGRTSAARQSSDALLAAVAERDSSLRSHVSGVAELACATAVRMGLGEEDREATRHTALLHDVGKVAIPDEILSKPAPLDETEWAFMKRHTIIGERIISAAPALARVGAFVRSTHECYDGSGYPDGLMGEQIPLVSRIVAVCDAYDAMTTRRAYRTARSEADSLAELHRVAGSQFDPEVVEAFASALVVTAAPGPAPARQAAVASV